MRTLTMIVLLVISSLTFGYEPYPPFFPTEYYLGYTFSEEKDFNYENFLGNYSRLKCQDVPSSVTVSAVKTAYNSDAKAIFAL